jgi:hypothetical protein
LGVVAVATQTSDITNNNLVCGFWTDANDINHGFEVFFNTAAHSFNRILPLTANPAQIPNVKSLSPFGCNDNGEVVGSVLSRLHGMVVKVCKSDREGTVAGNARQRRGGADSGRWRT